MSAENRPDHPRPRAPPLLPRLEPTSSIGTDHARFEIQEPQHTLSASDEGHDKKNSPEDKPKPSMRDLYREYLRTTWPDMDQVQAEEVFRVTYNEEWEKEDEEAQRKRDKLQEAIDTNRAVTDLLGDERWKQQPDEDQT
jgi:hypothetical protein